MNDNQHHTSSSAYHRCNTITVPWRHSNSLHVTCSSVKGRQRGNSNSRRTTMPKPGAKKANLPGYMCFSLSDEPLQIPRRSTFSEARKHEMREVRKQGACLRCRILKRRCSGGNPCQTCFIASSAAMGTRSPQHIVCIRKTFKDLNFYLPRLATALLRDIRPQRYLFDTQSPTHSHEIIATILGPDSSSHCGAGLNTPSLIRWLLDGEGSASVRQLSEFVLGRSNWDILCCVLGAYRLESLTTALRINILWNEECKSEVNRMVRNYSMARALIVLDDLLKPSNLEKLRAKKEYMVGLFLSLLAAYVVVVTGVGIDQVDERTSSPNFIEQQEEEIAHLLWYYVIYIGTSISLIDGNRNTEFWKMLSDIRQGDIRRVASPLRWRSATDFWLDAQSLIMQRQNEVMETQAFDLQGLRGSCYMSAFQHFCAITSPHCVKVDKWFGESFRPRISSLDTSLDVDASRQWRMTGEAVRRLTAIHDNYSKELQSLHTRRDIGLTNSTLTYSEPHSSLYHSHQDEYPLDLAGKNLLYSTSHQRDATSSFHRNEIQIGPQISARNFSTSPNDVRPCDILQSRDSNPLFGRRNESALHAQNVNFDPTWASFDPDTHLDRNTTSDISSYRINSEILLPLQMHAPYSTLDSAASSHKLTTAPKAWLKDADLKVHDDSSALHMERGDLQIDKNSRFSDLDPNIDMSAFNLDIFSDSHMYEARFDLNDNTPIDAGLDNTDVGNGSWEEENLDVALDLGEQIDTDLFSLENGSATYKGWGL